MKITFQCRPAWAALLLSLCAVAASSAGAAELGPLRRAPAAAAPETEARVIVKFRADSPLVRPLSAAAGPALPQHAQALSTRLGLALADGQAMGPRTQVIRGTGLASKELAARLSAQADVEYAVVDGRKRAFAVTPNDPLYLNTAGTQTPAAGQWYLQTPSATLLAAINAPAAWAITTGSSGVVVADLDTGVRRDHPDLAGKLLPGYDFIANALTAADGDGRDADPSDPGDFVSQADVTNGVPGCTQADVGSQSLWHGTQTSALIGAATNNGIGMAGTGRDVMVLPVRVLGKCGGLDSDIIDAMRWAAGFTVTGVPTNPNPARVINMSLGSSGQACSAAYQDAVNELLAANVVVVAAAGNDGGALGEPADCVGVISVGGVRHSGTKVSYSNLGPNLTISAPAGNCGNQTGTCLYPILTASNTGATTPVAATYTTGLNTNSITGTCSVPGTCVTLGTSFSTPLVSGTVGLMLSANPSLTPSRIVSVLKTSARAFPTSGSVAGTPQCVDPATVNQDQYIECYCTTSTCGAGLLDAGAAVAAVAVATANISVASTSVVVGSAVALDGSGSRASVGASAINTYQWAITSGATIASFTSATNASTATLLTSAAGNVVVSLTVTDSAGKQANSSVTLSVTAAVPVVPPPSSDGGGGGGGAMELGWLLGWLASVIGVRVATPRRRQGA